MRRSARFLVIATVAASVIGLAACGDGEVPGGITVSDAWSRQPAVGQATSAVYGVVANGTSADVTIVGATASVSDQVELHEMLMDADGNMTMQEQDGGFVVPAGGELVFESGGPHIMLRDVDASTYPDSIDVTLQLDTGETVSFTAEVRSITDG